ncbi:diacylglycerol kinase family protein [Telluribacter sp. SYSU D00476]|uniref:diacylglycerol kinase family protein n=1 Tax=Telluribacter sp. SYSU D00476 TaxID=2811430 RepID=UPI001FF47874|nr:diacylglycerol kinase family protein [Telluribacter sp. SYSU D00476]
MSQRPIDIPKALRSFRYAGEGIVSLFRFENNARIHLLAAVAVILLGFFFEISIAEWGLIITHIGLVWMAEAFNTAFEKLADLVSPEYHPTIKAVKDLAAGGVLMVALSAVIVGGLVFIPKLLAFFL